MTSANYTVFGARGFIGSELVAQLARDGYAVQQAHRDRWPQPGSQIGHAIFAIGNGDSFRGQPEETFDLNFLRLHAALTQYAFDSFTYLSSVRVYAGAECTDEAASLKVRPTDPDHTYNIAKIAAESLCLAVDNPAIRVVRLSNVFGHGDTSNRFLAAVLREAVQSGAVTIQLAPESSKDYVAVELAARAVLNVARTGAERVYNIATGSNVANHSISDLLRKAGYTCRFQSEGSTIRFPVIETSKYESEFGPMNSDPLATMADVVDRLRQHGGPR